MKVYSNGNFWGHGKDSSLLTPIPVRQTFAWEELQGIVPAVYAGESGAVLDLCLRVPLDRLEAFLKKWEPKSRLSDLTQEEAEQMEAENPCDLDFKVGLTWGETRLKPRQMCSAVWHPLQTGKEGIDPETEELMTAYRCDPSCGWLFVRSAYEWDGCHLPAPEKIKLLFEQRKLPVTAGYFITDPGCEGRRIEAIHPVTKEKFVITLCQYEAARVEPDVFSKASQALRHGGNREYPACYQALTYRTAPELPPEDFQLLDCGQGDSPREKEGKKANRNSAAACVIGGANGPTSIVLADSSERPGPRAAISSLHFEPVPRVQWREVFQIRTRKDLEVELTL